MSPTAVKIGALRVKFQKVIYAGRSLPSRMLFVYIKFEFIYHDLLNYTSTCFFDVSNGVSREFVSFKCYLNFDRL